MQDTSDPKGVVVTHGNLLHNEETIRRAFRQDESSVVVSWLPLYHDMGLIGGVRGRNYHPQDIEWTVERAHP